MHLLLCTVRFHWLFLPPLLSEAKGFNIAYAFFIADVLEQATLRCWGDCLLN
jgi:hypothetical protein